MLLAVGGHVIVTIASSLAMSFLGSLLLVMIQATLSEDHGEQRAARLTESNNVARILATFAPMLVGFGVGVALGWQVALYAAAMSCVVMALLLRQVNLPDMPRSSGNVVLTILAIMFASVANRLAVRQSLMVEPAT